MLGRFPSNAILSHDLLEGVFARTGLVSELELIDDYPSHFSAYSRRKHRWIRGDWQILKWLFPRVPNAEGQRVANPLNALSRWKILDNLRRSVIEAATFVLLLASWFFLPGSAAVWTIATVAAPDSTLYAADLLPAQAREHRRPLCARETDFRGLYRRPSQRSYLFYFSGAPNTCHNGRHFSHRGAPDHYSP